MIISQLTKQIFWKILNNLFYLNYGLMGACLDLEAENSLFLCENNNFLSNTCIEYETNGIGAGAVFLIGGFVLQITARNNSYVSGYGMLKGIFYCFLLNKFINYKKGSIIMNGAQLSEANSTFIGIHTINIGNKNLHL